jgi:hypothetical protein
MLISFHLAHPSAGAIGASLVAKVTVTMDDDQMLDGDGVGRAQLARE